MIGELDTVVLSSDIPEHALQRGDIGTVVLVHGEGDGFEVEFTTLAGQTVAIVTLNPDQLRPIRATEIAHARPLEAA